VTTHDGAAPAATNLADTGSRPTSFFELAGEYVAADTHAGQHSWYARGQNFVTVVTWARAGELLQEAPVQDEHAIVVPEGGEVEVAVDSDEWTVAEGPALVVVPAGDIRVRVRRAGYLLRVFTTRGEVAAKAVNASAYVTSDPRVQPLPESPADNGPGRLRVVTLTDVREEPGRVGRIYRTDSLMINVFSSTNVPRDTDALSPHMHEDFEQASVTMVGDYVHHVRQPWTKRMRDWRPDEHVQITSPSVTLIPPGNIHTTRAVGHHLHQLIDVFSPPRADFIERGWVLNQGDYELATKGS